MPARAGDARAQAELDRAAREREQLFATAPERDGQIALYACAWHDLDTCRAIGFGGAGPIPWIAIDHWALRNGFDDEATRLLVDLIQHLDGERAELEQTKRALNSNSTRGAR